MRPSVPGDGICSMHPLALASSGHFRNKRTAEHTPATKHGIAGNREIDWVTILQILLWY